MNITTANATTFSSHLIDRQEDLAAISALLGDQELRVLTLTGPGGVGKTRLAREVGRALAGHFPDGVVFVDLAPVRDPAMVLPTVASCLSAAIVAGAGRIPDPLDTFLRDRAVLLILDNFEQVLPAASELAELLAAAPQVRLLVTSREPLHLSWEQVYHVQPLAVPDPEHLPSLADLAEIHAVALFLRRAQAINRSFTLNEENAPAVAELMVHLDGLPLAIELAAARTAVLSPQMILERLGQRLALLRWPALDLPERHQTLRSAIAWSYDLLSPTEQAVFRRLGVFAGEFTVEDAETVAEPLDIDALDVLASLADKSLVQVQRSDPNTVRYFLLETIRAYARERLAEAGEREEAVQAGSSREARAKPVGRDILSPREQTALQLVAEGFSNKQIAKELIVAESTVRYHLTSIFNKLGADSRAHAVGVAAQRGLL